MDVAKLVQAQKDKERAKEANRVYLEANEQLKRGELLQAIDGFSKAIQLRPGNGKFFFARGNCYRTQEDFQRCLFDYTMAIRLDNTQSVYFAQRGAVFRLLERFEESLHDFEKAIELENGNGRLYYQRALTYYDLADLDAAIRDHTRAIELMPPQFLFKPLFHRGNCYREIGLFAESSADLLKAIELEPGHAAALNNLGLTFFEQGQFEDAVNKFSQAIELSPEMSLHYNNRGLAFYRMGKFEDALKDYDRALSFDEHDANVYFNRGNALRGNKEFEGSLRDFDVALRREPENANFHHCRGVTFQEMGKVDQAIQCFQTALGHNPNFVPSLYHMGLMLHAKSDLFRALEFFSRTIELDNGDRRVFESRGLVYQDLLYYDLAIEDFAQAISLPGGDKSPLTYYYRGKSYLWLADYDKALEDFEVSLKKCEQMAADTGQQENTGPIYNAKGVCLRFMQRFEEANEAFAESIKMDSRNIEYLFNRSQCFFDCGDYETAEQDLLKALNVQPGDAKLMYHLGLVRYAMANFEDSRTDFLAAIKKAPYAAFIHDCYYHTGLCCARLNQYPESVDFFTKAIDKEPENPKYVHERGKALQVVHRLEDSYRDFTRVIELEPLNAYAYFRRAFVLKTLGKFDAAAEDFEAARQLCPAEARLVVNYRKIHSVEYLELVPPGEEPEWGQMEDYMDEMSSLRRDEQAAMSMSLRETSAIMRTPRSQDPSAKLSHPTPSAS
eukprot:ANDGO_03586.mRNA.1 UDP-N-acetylglucosamine--peptide N-acetylglucosaminyltransferase